MDEFGSNLPKYLLDMSSDIMKIREPVKVALQKAVTLKIEGLQKLKKSAPRQLQAERLKVRKLFDHGSI
jgi:ribosomal protein S11